MANSDKNILITPSVGLSTNPTIKFNGANNTPTTLRVLDDGTVSFEGTAGQLFSISDGLTGSIFSVNDISGIPSIEVLDTGLVKINQYGGSTVYGASVAIQNGSSVNAKVSISTASATTPGLIIKAVSSQTANLQEWQNSSASILAQVDAYGSASFGGNNTYGSSLGVGVGGNASQKGITVRGTASQTANLQEWQNSAGTVLSRIASNGRMVISSDTEASSGMLTISQAAASAIVLSTTSTANDYGLALNATGSGNGTSVGISFSAFATNGYNGVATPGGAIWFTRSGSYSLGYLSFLTRSGTGANDPLTERMRIGDTGTVSISGFTASSQGLIVKGASSQTASLQEWQNNDGTVRAKVDVDGYMGSTGVFGTTGKWSLETAYGGAFMGLAKTTSTVVNPGSDMARMYLVAGTNAGTLKLVVKAGASGAETTILDNIPQS